MRAPCPKMGKRHVDHVSAPLPAIDDRAERRTLSPALSPQRNRLQSLRNDTPADPAAQSQLPANRPGWASPRFHHPAGAFPFLRYTASRSFLLRGLMQRRRPEKGGICACGLSTRRPRRSPRPVRRQWPHTIRRPTRLIQGHEPQECRFPGCLAEERSSGR